MRDSFPLDWPLGYKRTGSKIRSKFKQTAEQAQIFLNNELVRMGATDGVISSNVPQRRDGSMYTEYMYKKMPDPGVAVFFKYKGKEIVMCCDQYELVWENVYALGKGIEALRGMGRWGVSEFMERAFTGFVALPESTVAEKDIWKTLGLDGQPKTEEEVREAFRRKAKKAHPDTGGTYGDFQLLNDAYQKALLFFKQKA